MIRGLQRHLAAIFGGGRRRPRSVDRVSDSRRNSLLLRAPTCLFIFQTKNKNFWFKFFSLSLTTTIFSRFSRPIFVRKKCLMFFNSIFTYLKTSEGLLKITKIKDNEKTDYWTWPYWLARIANFGLWFLQRMLTISYFWYFLASFCSE